jgi:1-pyrroline-5-carboxylate dehydrogenase
MNLPEYRNEPYTDYTVPEHKAAYQAALERVRAQLGREYPIILGDQELMLADKIASVNPSNPHEVIGRVSSATAAHAEQAIQVAQKAFDSWKNTPPETRVGVLLKAAAIIRERKLEFNAWLTLEVGKNYAEAEGETAEAIDFLEYYARSALELLQPVQTYQLPGERDRAEYIPLGVGVSITPWNFPLAIFLGQACAPIVAGNAVIVKPAEDSAVVAYHAIQVLFEAGLPKGVVNYLPGLGEVVGDALVKHPKTRFISFTGSKSVGLYINAEAAKVAPGQQWIKRVTLELGGKDAMIVDETADLEAAANAAVAGAFGFAGQKCSALSRLIVVDDVYQDVLERVTNKVKALTVGDPAQNHFVNAVINQESLEKSKSYLETAPQEGRVVVGGTASDNPEIEGYYVHPTVVADVKPNAKLAQEEIFAPILAVIPVKDFDEAIHVFNDTDYGLTGGLFSSNPARLERAERELHVGNLYLNRKITGAMVGCHPFGGFNLSGTDSKAGGPDYLLHFVQMKSIARKI